MNLEKAYRICKIADREDSYNEDFKGNVHNYTGYLNQELRVGRCVSVSTLTGCFRTSLVVSFCRVGSDDIAPDKIVLPKDFPVENIDTSLAKEGDYLIATMNSVYVLKELESRKKKVIDTKNKMLVIVDMQNDFINDRGALSIGEPVEGLVKKIVDTIKYWEGPVVLTRDCHDEDSCEFNIFSKHCIKNTEGAEIVDDIMKSVIGRSNWTVIDKAAFTDRNLVFNLLSQRVEEYHFVGVCTHICVHDIIASLCNTSKDVLNEIPNVFIHLDKVADFNQEMADFSIKRLQNLYGVEVLDYE